MPALSSSARRKTTLLSRTAGSMMGLELAVCLLTDEHLEQGIMQSNRLFHRYMLIEGWLESNI